MAVATSRVEIRGAPRPLADALLDQVGRVRRADRKAGTFSTGRALSAAGLWPCEEVVAMSALQTVPAPATKAVSNGWVALIGLSVVAFVVGAAVQLGLMMLMDNLYGACVQSTGPCPQGSEYTAWQTVVVTIPTYLIWIAPAIGAARRGQRLASQGVRGGRGLMAGGLVVIALATVAGFLMWWIPGI